MKMYAVSTLVGFTAFSVGLFVAYSYLKKNPAKAVSVADYKSFSTFNSANRPGTVFRISDGVLKNSFQIPIKTNIDDKIVTYSVSRKFNLSASQLMKFIPPSCAEIAGDFGANVSFETTIGSVVGVREYADDSSILNALPEIGKKITELRSSNIEILRESEFYLITDTLSTHEVDIETVGTFGWDAAVKSKFENCLKQTNSIEYDLQSKGGDSYSLKLKQKFPSLQRGWYNAEPLKTWIERGVGSTEVKVDVEKAPDFLGEIR